MSRGGLNGHEVVDLGPVLAERKPELLLPADAIRPESLGVGELLRVCAILDVEPQALSPMLQAGGVDASRAALALAYVWLLRVRPEVTWDEVQSWRLTIVPPAPGAPEPDPTPPDSGPPG